MVELGNAVKGFSGLTVLTLVFLVASVSVVLSNRTVSRRYLSIPRRLLQNSD